MGETRWIDAEAAGRSLGVAGWTVRRWCKLGHVSRYRRVGLVRRYQITAEALDELRRKLIVEANSHNPHNPHTEP